MLKSNVDNWNDWVKALWQSQAPARRIARMVQSKGLPPTKGVLRASAGTFGACRDTLDFLQMEELRRKVLND